MYAMWMQTKAETLKVLRNPYYVFWSLAMPILFYFLFTKIINTGVDDKQQWQTHYLMSMTIFSIMGSSIMTLGIRLVQERTEGWSRFMRITPLSEYSYFFAKMMAQTVIHILSILVIFAAGIIINGVSLSFQEWLLSGLWILAGSLPFLALGSLIGTMKRVDTASGISNILYMALAIMGGMWMPIEILPGTMQAIAKWLPSYNLGNGAWEIISGRYPEWFNVLILSGYFLLFMILSKYVRKKQEAM